MKFALFFFVIALAVFCFREVFTKKDRRRTARMMATWLTPLATAVAAVIALVFFNLNFNGKII